MLRQKANMPGSDSTFEALSQLKKTSKNLKEKIELEKRRNDMPVDSKLGDPDWEESAADGHLDLHENEDE
jgi:hypothetical protein